ncbi:hypothetical protein AVEN_162180-1 [Araneus ventricosus]|uniref:Uncharacterized protein n=1 Tax=Araneus ventricosus TaxID=182803 RepID=A0A4Y2GVH0_ARAVE|nr:hypothetical protein AVEN_162180-1 [Araneus ventricosus]
MTRIGIIREWNRTSEKLTVSITHRENIAFIDSEEPTTSHRRISGIHRSEKLTLTGEYRQSSTRRTDIHRRISTFIDQRN